MKAIVLLSEGHKSLGSVKRQSRDPLSFICQGNQLLYLVLGPNLIGPGVRVEEEERF